MRIRLIAQPTSYVSHQVFYLDTGAIRWRVVLLWIETFPHLPMSICHKAEPHTSLPCNQSIITCKASVHKEDDKARPYSLL